MKISGIFSFIMLILVGNQYTILKIKMLHDAIEYPFWTKIFYVVWMKFLFT